MILYRDSSIVFEWLFAFGTLATIAGVASLIGSFPSHNECGRQSRGRRMPILVLLVVCWAVAFWQVRIRTGLGVAILGGADYWISKAANTESNRHAANILRAVLLSSNYGVNSAEAAVLRRDDPVERRRLFALLAQVAPWENWRRTFAARAEMASHATRK